MILYHHSDKYIFRMISVTYVEVTLETSLNSEQVEREKTTKEIRKSHLRSGKFCDFIVWIIQFIVVVDETPRATVT